MDNWLTLLGPPLILAAYTWRKPLAALAGRLCMQGFFGKATTDVGTCDERTPLLAPSKRTKDVIAKFEKRVVTNKVSQHSPKKSGRPNPKEQGLVAYLFSLFRSPKVKDETPSRVAEVARCPACRKKLDSSGVVTCEQMTVHEKCFVCHDCGANLPKQSTTATSKTVRICTSNGRVKFTCTVCQGITNRPRDSYASIAGERIVVNESEQGDINKVVGEIGDDLEQAVYFMTPRCATCGGDLQQTCKNEGIKVVGRTVFHMHCYDTGRPAAHLAKPSVKLPPSFCAKYLPLQIILKLTCDDETIATLYFCWKGREAHAVTLRQENADLVTVAFSLDEDAPANPNHPQLNSKRKPPKTSVPLPGLSNLKLWLVPGNQVGPREPVMPESPSIVQSTRNDSFLKAKLTYLYFGLEYCLGLQVPLLGMNTLDLVGARLSVTIQDWQQ